MINQLSSIVSAIVDDINKNRLSNMTPLSTEAIFEAEIRKRMSGFNLPSIKFYAGQEEWPNAYTLQYNINNYNYLAPHGNSVDIVINTGSFFGLIEIKKIYSMNGSLYKYLYTNNNICSPKWGDAPIYQCNGAEYFTFYHEGQIWQDIIRLINFGCFYDERFILGFVQQDSKNSLTHSNLQQRLTYLIDLLQKHFHNCPYSDGHGRVFSQLDQRPTPNSKVQTFLTPKSNSPFWVDWCSGNGFSAVVYPNHQSSSPPNLFAFLFRITP